MEGDTHPIKLESGHTVSCQEHTVTGRAARYILTGAEIKIVGLRAGFGPKDRNAWVVEFPGGRLSVASRKDFVLK